MFPVQDLSRLVVFAEVVRSRSFTRAARALGVSKSVVSAQVSALEKTLGVRLLDRSTRRAIALTQAGESVFASAERMLACAEEIGNTAEAHRESVTGTLRVAAPHAVGTTLIAPVLVELARAYPALGIELLCDDAAIDIARERVDVAVRVGAFPRSGSRGFRMDAGAEVIVAAPALLARYRAAARPSELGRAPWVLHRSVDSDKRQEFSKDGTTDVLERPSVRAFTNTTLVMRELLKSGVGFGVLPELLVADAIRAGDLVVALPGWLRRLVTLSVEIGPNSADEPQRVRLFVQALEAALKKGDLALSRAGPP